MQTPSNLAALIEPYGGELVQLVVDDATKAELVLHSNELPSVQLSPRSMCDLELLANGALSPLRTFMGEADYHSVLERMRLADGTLYPVPVTLPVADLKGIEIGKGLSLRSPKNNLLAVLFVSEIYEADFEKEALALCGQIDDLHPLCAEMRRWGKYRLSGELKVIQLPPHVDFPELRLTPAETREVLARSGNPNVVAFQTRNPMHRVHEELTKRAAAEVGGQLLIHPVVGQVKGGDVDHFTRVRTYRALLEKYYDDNTATLGLLELAMRMAGPRECVWHAIIRRNFGCNHMIVGRDHAGPGKNAEGQPFYEPYAARDLLAEHADEIGVKPLPYYELVYLPDEQRYVEANAVPSGAKAYSLSGTQARTEYLFQGKPLPDWFTRPEVATILSETFPPREKQGFCLWFTGLPSAGKSTIADILSVLLLERGKHLTNLDGDVVRTHLSKGLGFSQEDRDTNVLRIGFVASEIVRHHGIVVCAAVSPYRATRTAVRNMMPEGQFIEVFISTPVNVCEQRDVKGFYAKARAGEIKHFTGVDDPYEPPAHPEITLQTHGVTPLHNAELVLEYLEKQGFVLPEHHAVHAQNNHHSH